MVSDCWYALCVNKLKKETGHTSPSGPTHFHSQAAVEVLRCSRFASKKGVLFKVGFSLGAVSFLRVVLLPVSKDTHAHGLKKRQAHETDDGCLKEAHPPVFKQPLCAKHRG